MAARPARCAASALRLTSPERSPWSARRSEWPTITALAPASLSISAAMSPVWAPDASQWQSCAPTARREPCASLASCGNEGRRRADHDIDGCGKSRLFQPLLHAPGLAEGRAKAVHLPVPRHQGAHASRRHGRRTLFLSAADVMRRLPSPRAPSAYHRLRRLPRTGSGGGAEACPRRFRVSYVNAHP